MNLLKRFMAFIIILSIMIGNCSITALANENEEVQYAGLEKVVLNETISSDNIASSGTPLELKETVTTLNQLVVPEVTTQMAILNNDSQPDASQFLASQVISTPIPNITTISDSIKDPDKTIIYMTSVADKKVYAYNYVTGEIKSLLFTYAPEKIAFANNEVYVTLLKTQPHKFKDWSLSGAIAIIDSETFTLEEQFDIDMDPHGIDVRADGMIFITGSNYWIYLKNYSRTTLQEISSTHIDEYCMPKAHSTLNKVYTVQRYDAYLAVNMDSESILAQEYNGSIRNVENYYYFSDNFCYMGNNITKILVLSPDGKYIFNGGGGIYACSNNSSEDMEHVDSIAQFKECLFDLTNDRFYTIGYSNNVLVYEYSSFNYIANYPVTDTLVRLFNDNGKIIALKLNSQNQYYMSELTDLSIRSIYAEEASYSLEKNSSVQLRITAELKDGSIFDITDQATYSESNNTSGYVTVDQNGLVTGIDDGTAYVDVQWKGYSVRITIDIWSTRLESINLNVTTASIVIGQSTILIPTFSPINASDTRVNWYSSNASVASVSDTGEVVALQPGTTTIKVSSAYDLNVYATCEITVSAPPLTGVALDSTTACLEVGQSHKLHTTLSPTNAINSGFTWASTNSNVAYITNEGVIIALSPGSATIRATSNSNSNLYSECLVTVTPATEYAKNKKYAEDTYWGSVNANGTTVLVGTDGAIQVKQSASDPFVCIESGTLENLYGIAWNGSKYVTVGEDGIILISTNAKIWTRINSGTINRLNEVIWDGNQFIAVGEDGVVLFSNSGDQWSGGSVSEYEIEGIVYSGNKYIAVGSNGLTIASSNARDWYVIPVSADVYLFDVIWNGQKYVSVGRYQQSAIIRISSDGINWSTSNGMNFKCLYDVAWNGNSFVTVGFGGKVYTSSDANTWTLVSSNTIASLCNIIWIGDKFIASGEAGSILSSANGQNNWSNATSSASFYSDIIFNGIQFIAVGGSINLATSSLVSKIMTSQNGSDWTSTYIDTGDYLNGIAWNGNIYVAVGRYGTILTSSNGTSWTKRDSGTPLELNGICWNGSKFIVVGEFGEILISTDGITWNEYSGGWYNDLVWTGSQFVAVGPQGTIETSPNGINWTSVESNTTNDLVDISIGNNLLVAVGEMGTIVTSTNGTTWKTVNVGTSNDFTYITWDTTKFNVLDDQNGLVTSKDGQFWNLSFVPTSCHLSAIGGSGNSTIAVGDYGTIINSFKGSQNVTQVNLNQDTMNILTGQSIQLSATITPFYAANKNVIWTSSDDTVAIVDSTGKVSGIKAGSVTIKAKSETNGTIYDICTVTVTTSNSGGGGVPGGGGTPTGGGLPAGGGVLPNVIPPLVIPPTDGIQVTKNDLDITNTSGKVEIKVSSENEDKSIVFDSSSLELMNQKDIDVIISHEDLSLTLPANAISDTIIASAGKDATLNLQMNNLNNFDVEDELNMAEADDGKGLFSIEGMVFEFKAELVNKDKSTPITEFNREITIEISLDGTNISNINVDKLGVYWFNEITKVWEYIGGTYDAETNTITFTTSHFSLYSVFENRKTFNDIKTHWAKNDIEIMISKQIIKGRTTSTFVPDATITRAEFTALVIRVLDLTMDELPNKTIKELKDVTHGSWYYDEVTLAYNLGILPEMTNDTFNPDTPITREAMTVIMAKGLCIKKGTTINEIKVDNKVLTSFVDISGLKGESLVAVQFAIENGLINGRTSNTIVPQGNLTRAEAAVVIRRLMNLL